jgi:glycosyltransferase involved in cell wall biosynthesis
MVEVSGHKPRVAFVVQRYGLEVNGGAELLCRLVAEHLTKWWDIEVITTCAVDYLTWENVYSSGPQEVNGITVQRFPVDEPRDMAVFHQHSQAVFGYSASQEEELRWMSLQGPYSTPLFDYLTTQHTHYDLFIFFTYLYCTTFFGLPLVADRAVLVPTAHDEPPIHLSIFADLFGRVRYFIFNTPEEREFLRRRFPQASLQGEVVGVGIELPEVMTPAFREKYGIADPYLLYVGRIDPSKGCGELMDYFVRFRSEHRELPLKLVLLGKPAMALPQHPDIVPLGFVSEEDKYGGIAAAELIVMPSPYESLSMVLLEAWKLQKPTLVNGQCSVLLDHCRRAQAGLWYTNYEEFAEALTWLLLHPVERRRMAKNGRAYVDRNYIWSVVEEKYLRAADRVLRRQG